MFLNQNGITRTYVDFSGIRVYQLNPFACILDNVFDKEYCDYLIKKSKTEGSGYSQAMVNIGNGNQ